MVALVLSIVGRVVGSSVCGSEEAGAEERQPAEMTASCTIRMSAINRIFILILHHRVD
jgi:hypothetical protein